MKNKQTKKYQFHAVASNSGILEIILYLPSGKISKKEKEWILANELVHFCNFMLDKAYLESPTRGYVNARHYWERLLRTGKIPYKEGKGTIFLNLWIGGYLGEEKKVDEYVQNHNQVIKPIKDSSKRHGSVECPQCKEIQFEFNVNINNTNGICRACGFRIHTTT